MLTHMTRRAFLTAAAMTALGSALHAGQEPSYQIGCYTRSWGQHDYRAALDGIAEAGYRYVGIMGLRLPGGPGINLNTPEDQVRQVHDEIGRRKLRTISIWGDFSVAQSLEQGIEGLRRYVDYCVLFNCPYLLLGGTGDPKLNDRYYEAVKRCCDYAAEKSVRLTVKPHGGLNATGPQCRRLIESVGHRAFGLWYDPGNIFYYSDAKLDPVDDAKTVDGLVMGMSVKDYVHPKNVMVTPGTGMVDFPKVFATLRKGGFTSGPLVVECVDNRDLPTTNSEAVKARKFLEALTGQRD